MTKKKTYKANPAYFQFDQNPEDLFPESILENFPVRDKSAPAPTTSTLVIDEVPYIVKLSMLPYSKTLVLDYLTLRSYFSMTNESIFDYNQEIPSSRAALQNDPNQATVNDV